MRKNPSFIYNSNLYSFTCRNKIKNPTKNERREMKTQMKLSKSRRNYYVDIVTLLPFLMILFTGVIMLMYHAGKPYTETIFSKDRAFWLNVHILFAVITFVMVSIHLSLHLNWFKKLFSGKQKNKYWIKNLILVILFFCVTLTAVFPWLILKESNLSSLMLGLHNKIGLLLIVFFVIHLQSYFKWLFNMTKKEL